MLSVLTAFFMERHSENLRLIPYLLLGLSCFTGIIGFFMQLVPELSAYTWKAEPYDVHADFYGELLFPFLKQLKLP